MSRYSWLKPWKRWRCGRLECTWDGTVGEGGHTLGILEAAPLTECCALISIPGRWLWRSGALAGIRTDLLQFRATYVDMEVLATRHGFTRVDGVIT